MNVINRQNDLIGRVYDQLERKVRLSLTSLPSIAIHTFNNIGFDLTAVDISCDAAILAAGFSDALIRVYIQDPKLNLDIESVAGAKTKEGTTGAKKRELVLVGHSMGITCLSFSPSGYFLLSGSLDGNIRLWSIHLSLSLMIFKGHRFPIWDLKFSSIGYYFASASEDRTTCIWRTCIDQPVRLLVGHLEAVEVVEFHPNVHYVATGSNDKTIRL
jgi:transcription initiation factor TFIID subunit 5